MQNMIDISNVTDAALDCYLQAKADSETPVDVSGLTVKERIQVADLMGWNINDAAVACWING